ncbi:MAG: carboxypeptidase-like regulatory domain-containing protein [Planctomycetota bacterium]
MPWRHCDKDLLDDEVCPGCGQSKDQWTLEFEVTRQFRVRSRKKLVRFSLTAPGGDPVANERYEVYLPGETDPVAGTTNEDGFAKVEASEAGTARVRFPDRAPGSVRSAASEDAEAPAAADGDAAERSCLVGQTLRLELVTLADPRWSVSEARVGDEVELLVSAALPDGAEVRFAIVEVDADGEDDPVAELQASVSGGVARARWTFAWTDDEDDAQREDEAFPAPEYAFVARASEERSARSPELRFKDWYELEVLDLDGQPVGGVEVTLTLAGGEERRATTDEHGVARWEDVPAGPVEYAFAAAAARGDPGEGEPPAHPEDPQ